MAYLKGDDRSRYVQAMFSRIARRYDLMNRIMTGGQDRNWRKQVIHPAALPSGGRILDLGAGTGDLALEALNQYPNGKAIAADFTLPMMWVGKERLNRNSMVIDRLSWTGADANSLPFQKEVFDAVVSGFLLRNVADLRGCLEEQWRVLKPGGRLIALDTTPPQRNLLYPLVQFHLHTLIPFLGRMITGQAEAYAYLPASTESFVGAERLAEELIRTGFAQVGFQRLMFGSIAIHWGVKPPTLHEAGE